MASGRCAAFSLCSLLFSSFTSPFLPLSHQFAIPIPPAAAVWKLAAAAANPAPPGAYTACAARRRRRRKATIARVRPLKRLLRRRLTARRAAS